MQRHDILQGNDLTYRRGFEDTHALTKILTNLDIVDSALDVRN